MSWNYRIMRHVAPEGPYTSEEDRIWYGLHEVYYDDNGKPDGFTSDDLIATDTVDDLIGVLELMLRDARRYKDDVLEYEGER